MALPPLIIRTSLSRALAGVLQDLSSMERSAVADSDLLASGRLRAQRTQIQNFWVSHSALVYRGFAATFVAAIIRVRLLLLMGTSGVFGAGGVVRSAPRDATGCDARSQDVPPGHFPFRLRYGVCTTTTGRLKNKPYMYDAVDEISADLATPCVESPLSTAIASGETKVEDGVRRHWVE